MFQRIPKKQALIATGDVVLILAALYLAPVIRFGVVLDPFYVFGSSDLVAILTYLTIFYIFDFYSVEEINNPRYFLRFLLAATVATTTISSIYYFLSAHPSSQILVLSSLFVCLFLLTWRYLFGGLFKYTEKPRRILIVGAGNTGNTLYETLKREDDYDIVGFLDDDQNKWGMPFGKTSVIGGTGILSSLVRELKIDIIVIAITRLINPEVYRKLVEARFQGVAVHEIPAFFEKHFSKIPVLYTNEMWLGYADIYGVESNLYNGKIKKLVDKTLAATGLIILMPFLCVIALLIRCDSRGPAFYRQRRVGYNGSIFNLIKFRSMRVDAEANGALWAQENDPRVTRIGRILRSSRLDEIPQLWNVLKGELSLVGPRPERPEFVDRLSEEIPYYSLRHAVKPGITGWAQINYPYGASKEDALEKLQYDLYYIKNVTFVLDLYILLRTVRTILFRKGAR